MAVPPTPARMIAVTMRRELADRGEHEEAAEAVDRAEQDQEVARLEPGRPVADRQHRDRERQPAEPQHEQELLHELGAVRIRRPELRRHERLAGQDHHVANLLKQVLGRQEHPVGGGSDHSNQVCYHSTGTFATQCGSMCRMPGELDLSVDRGSRTPLGAQLAGRIRTAVQNGTLVAGERVPSVRELADIAGVNVNTARAVYARLESEGVVHSEQGRGTFVMERAPGGGAATRQELHRQIAALEAALVRLPPPPLGAGRLQGGPTAGAGRPALNRGPRGRARPSGRPAPRARRAARRGSPAARRAPRRGARRPSRPSAMPSRRATPSLAGARIRWVGA